MAGDVRSVQQLPHVGGNADRIHACRAADRLRNKLEHKAVIHRENIKAAILQLAPAAQCIRQHHAEATGADLLLRKQNRHIRRQAGGNLPRQSVVRLEVLAQQDADPDSVLNFYRKAVALRKSLSCVRYGEYREYNKLSGKHYLYSMDDGQQKILVVCSFAKKNTPFHAPKGFRPEDGELILCNYPEPQEDCLQPYECRVYLWK